jgi:hypothetical protein
MGERLSTWEDVGMRVNWEAPGWLLALAFVWVALSVWARLAGADAMPYVLAALLCAVLWRVARLEQLFREQRQAQRRDDVSE